MSLPRADRVRLVLLVVVPLVAIAGGGVLVAVGRPLRQHRQCLREGAHRADRARGLGPGPPRAGARPCQRRRGRDAVHHRIAAVPAGARQRRGRARRRAHPGRDLARHLARGGDRAGRRRGARRLFPAPVAAPGGAGDQGRGFGEQARRIAERRARRGRPGDHGAREAAARADGAERRSRAAGRRASHGARQDGGPRARRARPRAHHACARRSTAWW